MFSEELNKLIEAALVDGVITDQERAVIRKRALLEGVDPDEMDIFLDAEIHKRKLSKRNLPLKGEVTNFRKTVFSRKWSDKEKALVAIFSSFLFFFLIVGIGVISERKNDDESKHNYSSYQEAARAHDFEAAHRMLDKMLENYHNMEVTPYSDSWFSSNKRHRKELAKKEEMLKAYQEGVDYVFDAEALYLCSIGDKASLDRLSYLMSETKIEGNPITDGTAFHLYDLGYNDREDHKKYISSASAYNTKCDKLIDLAITNHNFDLINRVIQLYKPIPDQLTIGTKEQIMHYSHNDKDNAVDKINKAIDNGEFPNVTDHIK